ncbi:hypothetical protein [Aliiglaciecola litoralis]|uniref:ABC transmembrane type-1 domain-containing protein n=1 Tax=Aliiglaciecola litoralis TaxID=582857 RepID=A0ABP3WY57_9ALTE
MTLLAALFMLTFVVSVIKYGIQLQSIRTYIKKNHSALFKSYSLDTVSLLLGTDDVDWNFQKFIFKKQYTHTNNAKFVCMCNNARKLGLLAYSTGLGILLTTAFASIFGN